MNSFDSSFSYKYLEHIPFRFKYNKHKLAKTSHCITFDFRYITYNIRNLKTYKSIIKSLIKWKVTEYFITVCKHAYFYKFGPKLTGVCTRRMTQLKKEYSNKKVRKRCCNNLLVMHKEEWNLPPYKTFNWAR